jgi:formylglycine-generating enzyme
MGMNSHVPQRRTACLGLLLAALALMVGCEIGEGMVWIPGGKYRRGSDFDAFRDARPIRTIELDGFWMDETPVTNAQFAKFIEATGYITMAERKPDPAKFPEAPAENVVPGSICFSPPSEPIDLSDHYKWWKYLPGACWNHPEGPKSNIDQRMDHPVVHVSWDDAMAYAEWAGKRLPTESEWERASRGKRDQSPYVWGDELCPEGKWMANIWQGEFPVTNTAQDGWEGTSPVKAYPANDFGLYDMSGNVWQWCSDWYRPNAYELGPRRNPQGPNSSYDPIEPKEIKRTQRGGSFLCSDDYCSRYRCGGRGKMEVESSIAHAGFRCARSAETTP